MELIDRRKLLKHLSDWWLSETPSGNGEILFINGVPQKTPTMKVIEECIKAVEEQPTAYDPDKVVQRLERLYKKWFGEQWYEVPYLVKSIEIVKKGGANNGA